jgi:hypothetical protein
MISPLEFFGFDEESIKINTEVGTFNLKNLRTTDILQ